MQTNSQDPTSIFLFLLGALIGLLLLLLSKPIYYKDLFIGAQQLVATTYDLVVMCGWYPSCIRCADGTGQMFIVDRDVHEHETSVEFTFQY